MLGFRRWRLEGYGLRPFTSAIPAHWRLGPNTARCLRTHYEPSQPADAGHRAPHHTCECGLYAFHEPSPEPPVRALVSGAVLAWGRIETHAFGFRAEHAEPVVLAYHSEQPLRHIRVLKSVAAEFYLPVVEHAELAAAAAPLGRPIPPELRPVESSRPAQRLTLR